MTTSVNMGQIPRISDAEWKIMEIAWESPPIAAQQVLDALGKRENWKAQTIKTLIGRLVKKGALSYEIEGNRYLYSPLISREAAVAEETGSFLDRVARGSVAPLLSHLVETRKPLDADEIEALRSLLRQANDEEKGK
ncbi:MAG: BlaI/MecI/CopY family transcriptional regulator [Verrucomicrobiae bacterium]|nr:BlaI/MecI/CopY family transcriptional regulator [Verrucomicrobiae bacterium]